MNRAAILDESKRLTTTDREQAYGDCVDTHRKIASMWSLILSEPIGAEEVALCMAAVKMIRAAYDPKNADHFIDGAAYMAIAGECAGAGEEKPVTSAGPWRPVRDEDDTKKAYKEGFDAGLLRGKDAWCPYSVFPLREAWMNGHSYGLKQAQESAGAGAGDETPTPKTAAQPDSFRYAYELGLNVGKRSGKLSECPYPANSIHQDRWMHGWNEGAAEWSESAAERAKGFPEECSG